MEARRNRRRRLIPALDSLEPRRLLTTWYVDVSSPGPTLNGSSWTAAYHDLQLALAAASSGDTIRVADGTYKPTSTTSRTVSFQLKNGVTLLGGYAGYGAADPDDRNPATHPSVLSGNIGSTSTSSDNSYHVLTSPANTDSTAVLDGFTVTAGNANGSVATAVGAGLYNASAASPTVRSCTFSSNAASSSGGAVYNAASSSPAFSNCTFSSNSAPTGGAVYNTGSSPSFSSCTFSSNAASTSGGAVYDTASSPSFSNCTFTSNPGAAVYNTASSAPTLTTCSFTSNNGGAVYNSSSSPTITGCTFTSNATAVYNTASSPAISNSLFKSNTVGAIYNTASSAPSISGCTFTSNSASSGGAIYNAASSPNISDSTFTSNSATTGGAIYNAASSAPSISGCTFTSNSATSTIVGGGAIYNASSSSPSISASTFTSNSTPNFGGALYNATSSIPTLSDCRFNANTASSGGAIYNTSSSPTLTQCAFVANAATGSNPASGGGAIFNTNSSPLVRLSTFTANSANQGGAIYNAASSPALSNSILWANAAFAGGQVFDADIDGNPTLAYCDVQDGYAGPGNVSGDPLFTRAPSTGPDGVWGTADDDYGDLRPSPVSPAVDAGNNAAVPPSVTSDLAGNPRLVDIPATPDTGAGPAPVVDMGAYEAAPTLAAHAGGPYAVLQGQPLTLAARASSDVPGPLTYAWEWTGDGLFDDATGPNPSFPVSSYPAPTTLTLSLRVTDSAGHTTVATSNVRILPAVAYVDSRANPAGADGTSWSHAFPTLTAALAASAPGQVIRVAAGTYKPTTTTDRTASFTLRSGVSLYGGYAGLGAPDPDARDPLASPSVLSGDIGSPNNPADNSFHVLLANYVDRSALLDGFTVTAGYANGDYIHTRGGGMFAYAGSPTLRNCAFASNFATDYGGAIYDAFSSPELSNCSFTSNTSSPLNTRSGFGGAVANLYRSSPLLAACSFTSNSAFEAGAVYNTAQSSPTIANCDFASNSATLDGGAMLNEISSGPAIVGSAFTANSVGANGAGGGGIANRSSASPTITNCTFTGNSAPGSVGGAILNSSCSAAITGCTFTDNSATAGGGAIYNGQASPTLTNCSFNRNSTSNNTGGAILNENASSPNVTNCSFNANTAGFRGGAVYNNSSSPTFTNCTFTANSNTGLTSNCGGGAMFNFNSSSPTIVNCTFTANSAVNHGGAICNLLSSSATITNSILWDNSAPADPQISDPTNASSITYSLIQGTYPGTGNLSSDPLFYRPPSPGPDNAWGTPDDDYGDLRLLPGSPCIDSGSNAAVPANTTDLAGNPRITDFPATGPANTPTVDMGAYEQSLNLGPLSIPANTTITLPSGGYSFSATSITLGTNAKLDLTNSTLTLTNSGVLASASTRQYLLSHQLFSSLSDPTHILGYVDLNSRDSTSHGILVKLTPLGDANLDGVINSDDFALLDRSLAVSRTNAFWSDGDFNYDGVVDQNDCLLIDSTYAKAQGSFPGSLLTQAPTPPAPTSPISPSPTALVLTQPLTPQLNPSSTAKPKHKKHTPAKPKPTPMPKHKPAPALRLLTFLFLFRH